MNCLTFSVWFRLRHGGKFTILKWGRPWPHFCVTYGQWAVHYKANEGNLCWWRQLHFKGREHWERMGE